MFDWDAANIAHIARHAISCKDAEQVLGNDPMDLGRQIRNGEERTVHLGETLSQRILFVIVTLRGESIRVVTAFPADRSNRTFYLKHKDGKNVEDLGDT